MQTQPAQMAQPQGMGAPKAQWMEAPSQPAANCPPGLEYLTQVDQLLIHQQVELLEAFTGFETNNKYEIKNAMGQRVYFAAEESGCCARMCCGHNRPFYMRVLDNWSAPVMALRAPLACSSCWCFCCLKKVEIEAPPGNTIGYVKQGWSLCKPSFKIQDANEETVLTIEGPCCTWGVCGDVEFQVYAADGETPCGQIRKQWSGIVKEAFTDADNFGVTFPKDMDVKVKATLLGAVFLIDFMFFEKEQNKETDGPGMIS